MKKNEANGNGQPADKELNDMLSINTDENISGDQHLNEPVSEDPEVEKLQAQVRELNDRYLRQVAEFDNYRRRTSRERMELIQTAGKDVITELLDVLDDSERAEKQLESTDDIGQIREGVQLVFSKLRNVLAGKGLRPMDAVNKDFNPDLHEAITEIDAGDEMKGKVVAEVQKGYYLNDKIIRYAKVVVGK
ncbi:MAG TPA: nucleotide exchange factor GrpE [Flavisolibacter sp.]